MTTVVGTVAPAASTVGLEPAGGALFALRLFGETFLLFALRRLLLKNAVKKSLSVVKRGNVLLERVDGDSVRYRLDESARRTG